MSNEKRQDRQKEKQNIGIVLQLHNLKRKTYKTRMEQNENHWSNQPVEELEQKKNETKMKFHLRKQGIGDKCGKITKLVQ